MNIFIDVAKQTNIYELSRKMKKKRKKKNYSFHRNMTDYRRTHNHC